MRGEIYFKFNNSGKAKLELYMPCAYTDKVIKFDFNGFTKEIALPKVGSSSEYKWITIYEGQLQGKPDYSCLKVWNITKGYIDIQKLRITADSKVIEGVSYNTNTGSIRDRMAPYLLLYYNAGSGIESFYNEATVFDGCDLLGTYAAVLNWSGLAEGYAGLDVDDMRLNVSVKGDDNALMYALWNTNLRNDTEVEYQAIPYQLSNEATPSRFWWEDYGVRLWGLNMDWKTEKTYCFLVNARVGTKVKGSTGMRSDTTFYTLYWKEKGEKAWRFHGAIMSPRNGEYMRSLRSFLENRQGDNGHLLRKVRYANQWAKPAGKEWKEVLSARVTHYQGFGPNRTDKGIRVDRGGYIVWNGGYLPQEGEFEITYQREPSNEPCPITSADEVFFGRSATTAINMIRQTENTEYYDLRGNRVTKPERYKIYITNTGEKIMFSH
jgi:hypothetical protein